MKEGIFQEVTTTLSTYLGNITTVFTSLTDWTASVITIVMDNPVLLVGCTIGFAFTAVRLFKALR